MSRIFDKKFLVQIKLIIYDDYILEIEVLFDTGADFSCIHEGLIPTKFFEQTKDGLQNTNGSKLDIHFQLSNVKIQFSLVSIKETFLLAKGITNNIILGTLYIYIYIYK